MSDSWDAYSGWEYGTTDAQAIRDNAFLDEVKQDFVEPLWRELDNEIDGYSELPEVQRVPHIVATNEPWFGKGDSLPFGDGTYHVSVYAGTQLGGTWYLGNHIVSYYRPRFFAGNNELDDSQARDIQAFLYDEREAYDALPLAYRAALLCQYIYLNIVTEYRYVVQFVTGWAKELHPKRCALNKGVDSSFTTYCWNIRLRDVRPSVETGKELAAFLRWEPDAEDRLMGKGGSKCRSFEKPAPRASDSRSELAFAYVDELIRKGVKIGRGGDMTWDEVAYRLVEKYGDKVRSYTGNNLRDGYRKRNQRREGR